MAVAFTRTLGLDYKRMQFTPDVLPSDITGFSMYDKASGNFRYVAGSAMTNFFLADEINRASPKTQSALLEVMQEGRLSVDGKTYAVPQPFIVMATQNPFGSSGTQELPESQIDRFMIRITVGYPSRENEIEILKAAAGAPLCPLAPSSRPTTFFPCEKPPRMFTSKTASSPTWWISPLLLEKAMTSRSVSLRAARWRFPP